MAEALLRKDFWPALPKIDVEAGIAKPIVQNYLDRVASGEIELKRRASGFAI